MRYTEARLSPIAAMMLDDLNLDTVDYIPTYDERSTEPTVLPSKFPNLLVNGSARLVGGLAGLTRLLQTGHVYWYALVMLLGVFGLLTWQLWPALAGLAGRPLREYRITLTQSQMIQLRWSLLAVFPGAVLLVGGLVWWRRRS